MPPAEQIPLSPQPPETTPAQGTTPARQGNPESRWLSVEQIRKQQRCRRAAVIAAMGSGALPFEQRGRVRYARVCDVQAWEQARLIKIQPSSPRTVSEDLTEFL